MRKMKFTSSKCEGQVQVLKKKPPRHNYYGSYQNFCEWECLRGQEPTIKIEEQLNDDLNDLTTRSFPGWGHKVGHSNQATRPYSSWSLKMISIDLSQLPLLSASSRYQSSAGCHVIVSLKIFQFCHTKKKDKKRSQKQNKKNNKEVIKFRWLSK